MPNRIEVSVDEFVSKRSLVSKDGVVYRAAKMPKTFNAETRSASFVMSDETVDSYGDIVRAKGCNLDRFNDNPICLLNHKSDLVLGTWSDVKRINKRVEGTATLAAEGTAPHVDMAYNLMSQGILRAASIGFMPTKVERRLDEDGEPMWSYDILEWSLYECSVVSIPANPNALAKSMKDGCTLARDYLEEILDNYVKTPSGIIMNIADVESAYINASGEKKSIVIEKNEEAIVDDEIEVNSEKTVEEDASDAVVAEKSAKSDMGFMSFEQVSKLALSGVVFLTEVEIDGKTYGGDVIANSWDAAEKSAGEREPAEKVIGQLMEVVKVEGGLINNAHDASLVRFKNGPIANYKVADKDGNLIGEEKKVGTIAIDVDTSAAEEKIAALTTKAEGFIAKFGRLFGIKSADPEPEPIVEIKQKAPPTAEEMEAALTKAAAVRERIAAKSLIAA